MIRPPTTQENNHQGTCEQLANDSKVQLCSSTNFLCSFMQLFVIVKQLLHSNSAHVHLCVTGM